MGTPFELSSITVATAVAVIGLAELVHTMVFHNISYWVERHKLLQLSAVETECRVDILQWTLKLTRD